MLDVNRRATVAMSCLIGSMFAGCTHLLHDRTSVSLGTANAGSLVRPARLPVEGSAHRVPMRWQERGFVFGTDELVAGILRWAGTVQGGTTIRLGIADLSGTRGGASSWHRSHHSGRDVDLLFYASDAAGRPMPPPEHDMIAFGPDGQAYLRSGNTYQDRRWASRRFDVAMNWVLIEQLLSDPTLRVQWIFVSEGLQALLLSHAKDNRRPQWIIEYAQLVLRQPADSRPHDDHFHVRIYCSRLDRPYGCRDTGPVWQHEKKAFKYAGGERYDPPLQRALSMMSVHALL